MNPIGNQFTTITIPLSFEAHEIAERYWQQQTNSQKAKQVYLNILAVYAVNRYLLCLGYKTDWENSDSRNPALLKFWDVADLLVEQVGKLECRLVLPDEQVCKIPSEVQNDRVGYVAVRLDKTLKQADILGFVPTAIADIPLEQLRSLEEFIPYLDHLKILEVNLWQWLTGKVEQTWQRIEDLFQPEQPQISFAFRSAIETKSQPRVTRGQRLTLKTQLQEQTFVLVVSVSADSESEIDVRVRVYPVGQLSLSSGVQLQIQDELANRLDAESNEGDYCIQLAFKASKGEHFRMSVNWKEASVHREFVV
ncbi:MAG: DUF1822 family protein [Fischerella sp. CENA71]|nr:DUF1822 family protein [Fischerella sp. CENA71]